MANTLDATDAPKPGIRHEWHIVRDIEFSPRNFMKSDEGRLLYVEDACTVVALWLLGSARVQGKRAASRAANRPPRAARHAAHHALPAVHLPPPAAPTAVPSPGLRSGGASK